jgi:cytochrome c oxidase subunit 2
MPKQGIVAAKRTERFPSGPAPAVSRGLQNGCEERIATASELWFERAGFPHPADACDGATLVAVPCRQQAAALHRPFRMRGTASGQDRSFREHDTTMPVFKRLTALAAALAAMLAMSGAAWAGLGQPSPWQLGLQQAGSPVMDDIIWFHDFLLYVITAITVFVLVLLLVIIVRFNARNHPTPSRTTHNTPIEIIWTIVPVIILVAIAIPSFKLLFLELNEPAPDITVKATGKQWNWAYSYPDNGKFEFDSFMLTEKERKPDQPRLLAVDNEMVVPVNKVVHVLVTGADVIHSFAVPSFGIKIDAVPGRINETWFKATREGMYYGQCSELCGKDHAFMPIAVRVVNDKDFAAWVEDAKKKFARDENAPPTAFAAAGAPAE